MPSIRIHCPTCKENGNVSVSSEVMKHVTRGLLAINIANGIICSHSFIAYIDRNFNVRDYFTADFHIELPDLSSDEDLKSDSSNKLPSKEVFDIDLVRLNLTASLMTHVLKSIFTKQKIVLISEQEFLFEHFQNFFKYITVNTFDIDITIMTENQYIKRKKEFKDAVVFQGDEIIRNNKKIINPKKLLVEKSIINKFLSEHDLGFGYIILKNEIHKAFELSKSIANFIEEEQKNGQKINILSIQTELEKIYSVKINTTYLKFLIEIVVNYFGYSVPSLMDGFYNFL